jgi:hypothetical protein
VAYGAQIFAADGNIGPKGEEMGTGNGDQSSVALARDPRDGTAVVEADDQVHTHLDAAAGAVDGPQNSWVRSFRMSLSHRHEVDQRGGSAIGYEFGFEDERSGTITPGHFRGSDGRQLPAAVLVVS